MTTPTYTLPLSDADRATLRLHAVSVGKSPAQSDEALIAIYSGTAATPAAPAAAAQLREDTAGFTDTRIMADYFPD